MRRFLTPACTFLGFPLPAAISFFVPDSALRKLLFFFQFSASFPPCLSPP
nr:MAG TPA: hypothetical protein [Bacteriophage sp.]